ncbi:MAG: UvrD-helicase domain-containing protein [Psychroflexus maritimus]
MESSLDFKIYDASAGAGKTFTLAVDYLSLLLKAEDHFAFQKILAITFTNKAVGEMKTRILSYLVDFSKGKMEGDNRDFFLQVKAKTGLSKEEIQKKSKLIVRQILNNYGGFEISTIDAFTHRIIRTFAKDLGLTTNFEIELNTLELLAEAVDRLIDQAGEESELTQVLVDFVIEKTNEDKSGDISRDVLATSTILLNENHIHQVKTLAKFKLSSFKATQLALQKNSKTAQTSIRENAQSFFDALKTNGLEETHFIRQSIPKFFRNIQTNKTVKFDAKWQEHIEEGGYYKKSEDEFIKAKIDQLTPQIVAWFYACKEAYYKLTFYQAVGKNLTQLALLNQVQQQLNQIKKDKNLLLISDFNQKISQQIKNQPTPFIYERLGDRFQHYFIDEFQDTSIMQWENIQPLAVDAMQGVFANGNPGSLTLVGDAKQSIYAWRGGEAQQFIDLSRQKNKLLPAKVIPLAYNFRSEKEIIDFNNQFFEFVSKASDFELVKELFSEAHQKQVEDTKKNKGYVEISFLEAANVEEKNEVHPEKVTQIIRQRIADSAATYGDFCILVRGKKDGIVLAEYLTAQEIPIISSETLLIQNNPEVQFLEALMQHCLQPDDAVWKYKVLTYLYRKFEQPLQFENLIIDLHQKSFSSIITNFEIQFSLTKFESLPVYDAIEYAIQSFQLHQESSAHLLFFLDEIFQFSQKNQSDIGSFIRFWGNQKESKSISAPAGENAVQIMTIHKSKGLQFPIVILPYLDQSIGDLSKDKFWVPLENYPIPLALINGSDELENYLPASIQPLFDVWKGKKTLEDLNVLYVALTRAAKEMYLLSSYKTSKNGMSFGKNAYASFIQQFLVKLEVFQEEKLTYSFGTPFNFQKLNSATQKLSQKNDFMFTSRSIRQDLHFAGQGVNLWQDERNQALEEGNIIHWILSKTLYAKDVTKAIDLALRQGIITEEKRIHYSSNLATIIQHPLLKAYFEGHWEIKNEQDIAFEGKIYRPDRLCLQANNAVIIDYKTGEQNLKHHEQVKFYQTILEALGYKVQTLLLVYIKATKLEVIEVK